MTGAILTPERATRSAYVILVDLAQTPAITGGGVYEDVIVRTPEGWRFKKRDEKGLDQAATRRLSPVVLPARQHATERELPPIHDITTDTDDPRVCRCTGVVKLQQTEAT